MSATAAQDEFNTLMALSSSSGHESHSRSSSSSPTLAPSSSKSKSIRSKSTRAADTSSESDENDHRRHNHHHTTSSISSSSNINRFSTASTINRARTYLPRQRSQANTGPKGVIADAQAFHRERREHRSAAASRTNLSYSARDESAIASAASGTFYHHVEKSRAAAVPTLPAPTSSNNINKAGNRGTFYLDDVDVGLSGAGSNGETSDDFELSGLDEREEDDDFMRTWRQRRIKQLKDNGGRANRALGASSKRGVMAVDADGYLKVVEQSPIGDTVLVYIYDDKSEVSTLLEAHLSAIAQRYGSKLRCIKLHYLEAQMDPAGVPALIAYRSGDKIAALVPLLDDLCEAMGDDEDVTVEGFSNALKRLIFTRV